MLARTYMPSKVSHAVGLWREDLKTVSERAAATLADPAEYPNLFPDLDWALKVEQLYLDNRDKYVLASEYRTAKSQCLELVGQ